jgi:alkylation response protein AidB-like acyl-CoA dehydrogenase
MAAPTPSRIETETFVDLALSEDQQAIADLFGALLENECPPETVRSAEPTGFSAKLWDTVRAAGASGMALPESIGGGGTGLLELALVAEEVGRRLAPVPVVEHGVAARLLARLVPDHPRLPDLAEGAAIAALALHPARGGVLHLVPGGAVADIVIGWDGEALRIVDDAPPGTAPPNLAAAPLADRHIHADAAVLATGSEAWASFENACNEWRALTGAALVGVGQGAFDLGLAYVNEREQFGRPIGAFQAIQHGLADVAVPLDGARLLARKAAWAFDSDPGDAARLAGMALLFCSETAQQTARRCLQYHGGYGVSAEYDIQLYFRRAKGWALVAGDPEDELQLLGDTLFGPRESAR